MKHFYLKWSLICLIASMWGFFTPNEAFTINGRQVLDANGNEFVMRGINYPHTWFEHQLSSQIPAIKATGANSVRVVLSNGAHSGNWGRNSASDVENVINICLENKLVPILEVHDCTGYGDEYAPQAAHISTAVDYWIEIKDVLLGREDEVIINIANEPIGNVDNPAQVWKDDHITAIQRLRDEGFRHLLMVDAPNWGQDWSNAMRDGTTAQEVFDADPQRNIIFSVHMYEVYAQANRVNQYFDAFVSKDLPLVVGEFADTHKRNDVAWQAILDGCEQHGFGYIGWSWMGNTPGAPDYLDDLDMVQGWNDHTLTPWGENLINGRNGIAETSVEASIFSDDEDTDRPPIVSVISPDNNSTFTPPATIILTATANAFNADISRVEFFRGDTKLGEATSAPYSYEWSEVDTGTHLITARATDSKDQTTASTPVTIIVGDDEDEGIPGDNELLINGDFSASGYPWVLNTHDGAADGEPVEGVYTIQITDPGEEPWNVQFIQSGLTIEEGAHYVLSFNASAESERTLSINVAMNDEPYTSFMNGGHTISLTTSMTPFEFEFTMEEPTYTDARVEFNAGEVSDATVYISNASLKKVSSPTSVSLTPNFREDNLNITTQVCASSVLISFDAIAVNNTKLSIYDLKGSLISTTIITPDRNGRFEYRMNRSDISNGHYLLRVSNGKHVHRSVLNLVR
ncbi:cellulase family glycosylhydrolase [Chitinispirillales bacterium ANBcel5]|uniref:cellulase family glycosylhydrolase n=1 Tax=Cellulosispirillum alkaliphilum TaxID=3039283 RepID=UPI002A5058D7|nr:cellulase family glycosylhydrolase [Chitinispirillales bacterium ANBcel5]